MSNDYLMDIAKLTLLVCLVVGIIIRNQSNKAGLFGILDQFKKINQETSIVSNEQKSIIDRKSADHSVDKPGQPERLSDSLRKASSEVLAMEIEKTPYLLMIVIQFFNALIPAVTAILVKDSLINYVEGGSGFLAPVFLIIYPCKTLILTTGLMTIRLHQKGIDPVSPTMYIFIWFYLIIATFLSYLCLILNFTFKYFITN